MKVYMKLIPEQTDNPIQQKQMQKRCLLHYLVWFYLFFLVILITFLCIVSHCHALNSAAEVNITKHLEGGRNRYEEMFDKLNDVQYWMYHETKNYTSVNLPPDEYLENARIVCYYVVPDNNSWFDMLPPESVDPYFCTHIIVGFAQLYQSKLVPDNITVYEAIIDLKKINPKLKVLLSVEEIASYGEFSKMISSDAKREEFINSTFKFINETGFDGIDIDWEFPSWPDANLNQVRNYTLLLKDIRDYIDGRCKGKILSVAVAAPGIIMEQSYEIDQMARYVDFVNVMSYDYHMYSKYLPLTGPNSPLYPRPLDAGYLQTLNIDWSAFHWAYSGMPKSKINVGIPTYGHSYTLINEDNNGWSAPAKGFGKTGQAGFLTYPDACEFLSDQTTSHFFDENYQVPYAFNRKEWMSYENVFSVNLKAQYILDKGFGGAMIYSLNADDFRGKCGKRNFALTREINSVLTK